MEQLIISIIFAAFLIVIALIDLKSGLIYNKILLVMAISAIIFDLSGILIEIDQAMIAALIGFVIMYVIFILSRGGLGGGDVKFTFVLGLWLGLDGLLIAIFLSTIFASIVGLITFAIKRSLKIKLPFAPFMSLGAVTAYFFKEMIILNVFL
ncbi:MAG: prepilin peptidase [Selenomonadaceae bacterium]|nr:prepilin peptidase [Selenomonadaceae bacterium]